MSQHIKASILKHLSEKSDTWSSTVAKVSEETGMGSRFVEQAMQDLVEHGELKRMAGETGGMPSYAPPGKVDGKYGDFYQKRLEAEKNPAKSGTYEEDPRDRTINSPEAV